MRTLRRRGVWGGAPQTGERQGSGIAADQTNAMLATSKEVMSPAEPLRFALGPQVVPNGVSFPNGSLLATLGNLPQIAARCHDRVNRVDLRDTLDIDTIGTAQLDKPLSVAAAHHAGNAVFA